MQVGGIWVRGQTCEYNGTCDYNGTEVVVLRAAWLRPTYSLAQGVLAAGETASQSSLRSWLSGRIRRGT
jgi:hypothetical protein